MKKDSRNFRNNKLKIDHIDQTSERLTGRAGLAFFVDYIHRIGLFNIINRYFGSIRKSRKGIPVHEIVKQILCFFIDGSSRHLSYFDKISKDEGYAGSIETDLKDMASSHQVKRFFNAFSWVRIFLFRRLLHELFIWRLCMRKPLLIVLGIDTMVMDNDDSDCREGVKPTYKRKKGFQPLQMNWDRFFIDAVFRGGDKHSNHGESVQKMIEHMVSKIRKKYNKNVPIIIRMDSGFFDQKIFKLCEDLKIGYICGGKLYKDIKSIAAAVETQFWSEFKSGKKENWEYIEFGTKRQNWSKFRRAVYSRLTNDGSQLILPGCRPDTVIITNLGQGQEIDKLLKSAGREDYLHTDKIISCYHQRGADELANRALKDFGHEQLPFKRFESNAAWYYFMLTGLFIMESFKEDIHPEDVTVGAYANTVRRRLIDIAGKIVTHAGKIILKISKITYENLKLKELINRCRDVQPIC
jgi:hypothetical protein